MNKSLLAGRYAKALLAYALEVGEAEMVYPLLRELGRTLRPSATVDRELLITNPTLTEGERSRAVVALMGDVVPESLRRFVDLVFSHNRESLLGEMARAYIRLYRRHKGITFVRITSAEELNEELLRKICEMVRHHRGGEVEVETIVDRGLIGGFVLRVDGEVMDGSARSAIERIRQQFVSKNKTLV